MSLGFEGFLALLDLA
jgi:hypothetical protein